MQRHLSQTNTAVQPSGTTLSLCTETQSRAGRAFKDPHSYTRNDFVAMQSFGQICAFLIPLSAL